MRSVLQVTTRPRLGPLGHSSQLPSRLSKRSSQRYARAAQTFSPQPKKVLNLVLRRPAWSSHRSYNNNSYGYYTPESFWVRNKPNIVVGSIIGFCCVTYYYKWTAENLAAKGNHARADLIRRNFVNSGENLREGRWWVMISSSFAHGNLMHLGFSVLPIWGFGRPLVGLLGVPCFMGLCVISAVSSSRAYIYWEDTKETLRKEMFNRRWDKPKDPRVLGIQISKERALAISGSGGAHYGGSQGASGIACGLTGARVCIMPWAWTSYFSILPMPLWAGETLLTIASVVGMATGYAPIVGHAGHLGGTAVGIAYYYGIARPWLRRTGRF